MRAALNRDKKISTGALVSSYAGICIRSKHCSLSATREHSLFAHTQRKVRIYTRANALSLLHLANIKKVRPYTTVYTACILLLFISPYISSVREKEKRRGDIRTCGCDEYHIMLTRLSHSGSFYTSAHIHMSDSR